MKLGGTPAYLVLSLTLAAVGCGEGSAPDRPTYVRDIQPLMESRCIRCHGANGTLNADPEITGLLTGAPLQGDFTRLEEGPKDAPHGLLFYTNAVSGGAARMHTYVVMFGMPPPPSDPLTDREKTILFDWANAPLLQ